MTKIITAAIILLFLWGGWELFFYWERVKNEQETQKKQEAAAKVIGDNLPGMPYEYETRQQMEKSLKIAESQGATAMRNWLKAYGDKVKDPRKAWIELDYCQLVAREDTPEAKRVFAEVKARTTKTSPVWPRIEQMSRTYE
jgi:hypothetical protein